MRASRVRGPIISRSSTCGNARIGAISGLDVVADELSQSPSVKFVRLLPVDNGSMNVQASAGSDVRLTRSLSVVSENNARVVRTAFNVGGLRRAMSVC